MPIDVSVWLMDQPEIEIVCLEFVQRALKSSLGSLIARIFNPELSGYKQIAAADPMVADRVTDRFLVAIRCCGIEKPVTDINGVPDTPFALGRIRNLKHAEAKRGHLDAIVQCHCRNGDCHDCSLRAEAQRLISF